MKTPYLIAGTLLFTLANVALAEVSSAYVSGAKLFLQMNDPNRQAEAWGTCAAAYQITSEFMESDSNNSKQFKELSNGAAIAVTMTHVNAGLHKDMSQKEFNALWNFSKTLMSSIPEVQRTRMLSDFEFLGQKKSSVFFNKLEKTVKICIQNIDGQQFYIDSWRNLAKTGLLQIPD